MKWDWSRVSLSSATRVSSFFPFLGCCWEMLQESSVSTSLQSIGCDDYLGSNKVVDKCGVCGGDNTGCQVVSGVFKHALTSLGYHRVVEIPQGATKINITEMHKSNNYLGKFDLFPEETCHSSWFIPGWWAEYSNVQRFSDMWCHWECQSNVFTMKWAAWVEKI